MRVYRNEKIIDFRTEKSYNIHGSRAAKAPLGPLRKGWKEMRSSRELRLVILATTGAVALGACRPDYEHSTRSDCEATHGENSCVEAPLPVKMTDANRPDFATLAECEERFGEGNCPATTTRTSGGSGAVIVRHQPYMGSNTHYYPNGTAGYSGYYRNSPHVAPQSTSAPGYVARSSPALGPVTSSRGGFGATASGHGGSAAA